LLERAFAAANGTKLRALYDGDTSDHGGDDSAADLALCNMLAFWTGPDLDRIDVLFRGSGLYRGKWDREGYRQRTIETALATRTEFYDWEKHANGRKANGSKGKRAPQPPKPVPTDPGDALSDLGTLWGLTGRITIERARITGHGREASCEVDLSNGETMVFERLQDIATGASLAAELASRAGVAQDLNQAARIRSIALISRIAEWQEAETANSIARDWGIEFLATSGLIKVDMDDRAKRWLCLLELQGIEAERREQDLKLPRRLVVPVDLAGVRYVRVGWFQAYVRECDRTVSPAHVVIRMLRVGWQRRGTEGRIGARNPEKPDQTTNSKFLLVPVGWGDLPDDVITADNRSARAREMDPYCV
jgi:NrS-1  polymerase HBD domain